MIVVSPRLPKADSPSFLSIAGAICLWFLRAWKIRDLERIALKQQQRATRDGGVLSNKEQGELVRSASRVMSVKSTAKSVKALYAWQRV